MTLKKVLILFALSCISFTPFEKEAPESKKGRESYAIGDFEKAEEQFSKASERLEKNGAAHYNSGNAKLKKGDIEGALLEYGKALETTPVDKELRSRIFHNMGNVLAELGKYKESEKLFIRSLIENPTEDAAENLEIVRRLIELQEEEEPQDQDDDSCDQGDESEEKDSGEEDSGDEEQDSPSDSQEMEEDEEETSSLPEEQEEEKEEEEVDSTILEQFNQRKNLQISPFMLKKEERSESGQTW